MCEAGPDVSSGSPVKNEVTWLSPVFEGQGDPLAYSWQSVFSLSLSRSLALFFECVSVALSLCIHARPRVSVCLDRWLLIVFS